MGHNGLESMRRKQPRNQLELFSLRDGRSVEEEILRLEAGIRAALRRGNLRLAADLTRAQSNLLQRQIGGSAGEFPVS